MYWPTSFCERENSSKRWRISSERVSAVVPVRVTGQDFAGGDLVPSVQDALAALSSRKRGYCRCDDRRSRGQVRAGLDDRGWGLPAQRLPHPGGGGSGRMPAGGG